MNWKLILLLSGFGVAIAAASLFGWTKQVEPLLWLAWPDHHAGDAAPML